MIEMQVTGLDETVRKLKQLPVELGSKGGGPIRYGLFQASKVIRDSAQQKVPVKTGNLRESIGIKRYRNPRAKGATERYAVGIVRSRSRKTIARAIGGKTYDAWYGRLIELGTSKMRAQPYLRPAFEEKKGEAVQVFAKNFRKATDLAVKKLNRK